MNQEKVTMSVDSAEVQAEWIREFKKLIIAGDYPDTPLAHVRTYGCQQNVADSEKIKGILAQMGFGFTEDKELADFILFNTCAIREHAEDRVLGNIGALKNIKRHKPGVIIAVCGCMMEQEKVAQRIRKTFPFVNIIFGPHVIYRLPQMLLQVVNEKTRVIIRGGEGQELIEGIPKLRDGNIKAWVTVMYGCDNFCSYCIVPYVRGREKSRDFREIYLEFKSLVEAGYKEITLLGQNVNSYGKFFTTPEECAAYEKLTLEDGSSRRRNDLSDEVLHAFSGIDAKLPIHEEYALKERSSHAESEPFAGKDINVENGIKNELNGNSSENDLSLESGLSCGDSNFYKEFSNLDKEPSNFHKEYSSQTMNFSKLLRELDKIPGDYRIRFMTSHPKDATKELIDTIANSEHIPHNIHLPFQSGNDRVLKAMNRKYDRKQYLELITYAKKLMPDCTFTSDVIVGFPGENYEEFKDTISLIEEVKFTSLFTFIFSKRDGTKAALLEDLVPHEEKVKWFHELLEVQASISEKHSSDMVGLVLRVLVFEKNEKTGNLFSRAANNMVVEFAGEDRLVGSFVEVKITAARNWTLIGKTV